MLVLTATRLTNGDVADDYDFCIEGELLYLQEPCASDARDPDGGCGCGRGFAGANPHRATTTALVSDSPLTESDVREALRSSMEAGGWLSADTPPDVVREVLDDAMRTIASITQHFPVGTVVRRRVWQFSGT